MQKGKMLRKKIQTRSHWCFSRVRTLVELIIHKFKQEILMMPHQVRAIGFQSAAAEVLHMPTSSLAASGTFLKNKTQTITCCKSKNKFNACDEMIKLM